jgi:hypothetical protein
MYGLRFTRCCDAFVSVHHREGFGRGLAEAMAFGKLIIGTAWSGNMAFMNAQRACLVDFQLIPVKEGEYPSAEGQVWASRGAGRGAGSSLDGSHDPVAAMGGRSRPNSEPTYPRTLQLQGTRRAVRSRFSSSAARDATMNPGVGIVGRGTIARCAA